MLLRSIWICFTGMNDYYMRHISDSICSLNPTHVAILGDIFSYQSLTDREFEYRFNRFRWIFECCTRTFFKSWLHTLSPRALPVISRGILIINVTGNHDLGYGAELSEEGLRRFERHFGPVNSAFEIEGHTFVNLNSLNLDASYALFISDPQIPFVSPLKHFFAPLSRQPANARRHSHLCIP